YEADSDALRLLTASFPSLTDLIDAQRILRNDSRVQILPEQSLDLVTIRTRLRQLAGPLAQIAMQWRERSEDLKAILRHSTALGRSQKTGYRLSELEPSLEEIDDWLSGSAGLPPPSCFEILGAQRMQKHLLK